MTDQLSLLDVMMGPSAEAIGKRCVCEDGPVVQGEIDHVFEIPGRNRSPTARIEVHRHDNGYWMWAVQRHFSNDSGGGYRVGPKWGRFAVTRFDALFYACRELDEIARHAMARRGPRRDCEAVLAWTARLVTQAADESWWAADGSAS